MSGKIVSIRPPDIDGKAPTKIDDGGSGGDDGGMEARLSEVEKAIIGINKTLELMRESASTKADVAEVRADLHKMDASISRWGLATVLTFAGLGLATIFGITQAMKSSPAASASAPQPIVIQLPPQTAAPAPPASAAAR